MSTNGYWWIALGLGAVVAVVAIVLLQMLLKQVKRVESAAGEVWTAGRQIAANTANTWILGETVAQLDLLTDEAMKHVAFFQGANGSGA